MTVSEANDPLSVAGLRGGQVSQTEYSEVIEAGRIIRSEPAAGEKTDPDTWVALIVSDGPEPLQLPPRVVQGRVLWNETPVADAAVYARDEYSGDSTLFGQSVTDAQGWFEITGIPAGEQYLYVHGSGPEYWVSVVTPFTMASDRGSEVDDTYLCKGFTPISPIDGSVAATDRTVLKWEPFPDAVDYAARVTKVGKSNFSFQKGDSDARINDTEIQVTPNLSPGDYRWRVDAFNSKGHMIGCSYYDKGRFTIPQQSHTPVISHVLRREESDNGQRIIYQDIYFTDLGGDAFLVAYELVSTTKAGIIVENDPITASSEEQKIGAFVTGTWKCGGGSYIVTLRATILDQAGNTSNPVEIVFDCN